MADKIAFFDLECIRPTEQESVEVIELSPLALVPHPDRLAFVPSARAMEQIEGSAAIVAIAAVEILDALPTGFREIILIGSPGVRIGTVRQEREAQIRIAVGQIVDLQPFDERLDIGSRQEQRRHHDEGPAVIGHAVRKIQPRQSPWSDARVHDAIDEGHCRLRGRDDSSISNQAGSGRSHRASPMTIASVVRPMLPGYTSCAHRATAVRKR